MAFVLFAEELFEHIQTLGPEALVEAQPLVRALERSWIEAAEMGAPAHLALDQSGAFEHLDVLRSGRKRHCKGLGELADGSLTGGKLEKHLPARGIAQRVKDRPELRRL